MSSRGKKKTTMAKLSRESRLRERRSEKIARKEARKNAPPVDERAVIDDDGPADDTGVQPDDSPAVPSASAAPPSPS